MPRDYNNLTNNETELIIKEGLQSEFWKLLTNSYQDSQKQLLDQVVSLRLTSWDDLVRIVNLLASYKTREEIFNWPQVTLKSIEIAKQQQNRLNPNQP